MILRKVSLLTTLLLITVLGCEYTKPVMHPVDTIVPLSPEMSHTLMAHWGVSTIDGEAFSESLSQLQTLVTEHVNDEIDISFSGIVTNPIFRFNADGTWELDVDYSLGCEHNSATVTDSYAEVSIRIIVGGTYIAGYDTGKQSNVLIFETDKHTEVFIRHFNIYHFDPFQPQRQPHISDAFTADLDWRIFEDEPLSKIFSSPLFDTETDSPVVYTWDMVISGDAGVDYTIRLYSQGQEDIILGRTDEVLD